MNEREDRQKTDHGEVINRPRLRLSWAWVFPILAATATAWLFWSNWKSNGPEIEIVFDTAPGMQAGKTPLIYRGVTAGKVTSVRLDKALEKVVIAVRLKTFAAELAREGTVFWIDQPVVGLAEMSGLDALIQGNSLQARMGSGPPTRRFTGVDTVPLTPLESPALILKLRAPHVPSLDRGSPLFYRGLAVGIVESKALDDKGVPYLRVVVEKEFAKTVRSNSRFWPVAATSVRVGPSGIKLDLMGLKAMLLGGMQFDVFGEPGESVKQEAEFILYPDQSAARSTGEPVRITFENGFGIEAGQTQVRYLGLPVGIVDSAKINFANKSVDTEVRFQPEFENLHNAGAVFTLVRPHISIAGISGLETFVGGVYIDCEAGTGTNTVQSFEGRTLTDEGLVTARLESESLPISIFAKSMPPVEVGAPVFFRGIVAGHVTKKAIDSNNQPYLDAVIRKDFAKSLTRNARFWALSGASVQAGPGVLNLDVAGIQSLVQGGVTFEVFGEPGEASARGAKFELFSSESAARAISPPIRIQFENGQGLLAGQTQVRYLGVPVGLVVDVKPKKGAVEVVARLDAGYEFLRTEGSSFSVVRLNLSLNGVTGLETVVSGVYVECVPAGQGKLAENFTGVSLGKATFEQEEKTGFEVIISASQSSIDVDAPVSYRGLVVGKVARKVLSSDGEKVGLHVIINPPYASLIRENTKFWDAGGVKVSLGFLGVKVQASSLESIARGGLAFATPDNMGPVVRRGTVFELYPGPRSEWLRWAPKLTTER